MPVATPLKRASGWSGSWSLLRDVEIICAVIIERKTTGAAQRLGISQPAVSRAIAKIEERLGQILFHRDGGRLVPTAEALLFYERSCHIFEALETLEKSGLEVTQQRLIVLAMPTISHLFLRREVAAFVAAHPEITMSLDMDTELPNAISEGRGHLGIIDLDFMHSGVVVEPFLETTAVCYMPEGHPLAAKLRIVPQDLHEVPFIGINRRHAFSAKLEKIFADAHVAPRFVMETDVAMLAADFVRDGLGVTILNPFPTLLDERPGLVARPFEPAITFRTNFVLPANEPLSAPARKFIDFVKARRAISTARLGILA